MYSTTPHNMNNKYINIYPSILLFDSVWIYNELLTD